MVEQFLALLAKQEYNKAVSKVFRSLAFFTGCTTFVYALGLNYVVYQGSLIIKSFLVQR